MLTLILMRHGHAVDSHQALSDYTRGLTPEGRLAVQRQAGLLKPLPELIISSSALRTTETAGIIISALKTEITLILKPELYHAQADDYFELLQTVPDKVHTLLLIGHNPSISRLASSLAKTNLSMAPADTILLKATHAGHWAELTSRDFQQSV